MKTTILYLLIFFSAFISCNSQEIKQENNKAEIKKPHEEVTVNRKYDENGNLIEFDSTYTYYYSNIEGDTIDVNSMLNDFPAFFNNEFFNLHSKNMFNPFFNQDSTLSSHFFHDDFFEQQFINQNEEMFKMIQEMDSIKNLFFMQQGTKK
jgi:hypothetical protein